MPASSVLLLEADKHVLIERLQSGYELFKPRGSIENCEWFTLSIPLTIHNNSIMFLFGDIDPTKYISSPPCDKILEVKVTSVLYETLCLVSYCRSQTSQPMLTFRRNSSS